MKKESYILILLLLHTPLKAIDRLVSLQDNGNVATLVIYVKPNLHVSTFGLLVNDKKVINSFTGKSYYLIKHSPGKINLKTRAMFRRIYSEDNEYSLTLEAGNTYYLEAIMEYQVLMTSMHLIKRAPEVGEKEIYKMKGKVITLI